MEDVCALGELTPREPSPFRVNGREIVLTLWRGEVFAVRNTCPHQGQSFVCGNVVPQLASSAPDGEMVADDGNPLLICPWHTWGFELRSGRCTAEPTLRVRTYPVMIRDGRVLVDI